jgi:hypothetical protein
MKEVSKKDSFTVEQRVAERGSCVKICHSDESSYEIGYDSRGYYITRAPHEDMLERNLKCWKYT